MLKPVLLALCVVVLVAVLVWHPGQNNNASTLAARMAQRDAAFVNGSYTLHFINVSQGDATLLQAGNMTMLIDCGDNAHGAAVLAYLRENNVSMLNYLVATHADADHIGGCDTVLHAIPVLAILENGVPSATQTYADYDTAAQNHTRRIVHQGDFFILSDVIADVLNPSGKGTSSNSQSIVLKVTGKQTAILAADCETTCETALVASNLPLAGAIYKAGHHGSAGSSTDAFLGAIKPSVAIISAGSRNRYGHPNAQTLERFAERNMTIRRTDYEGTIVVRIA